MSVRTLLRAAFAVTALLVAACSPALAQHGAGGVSDDPATAHFIANAAACSTSTTAHTELQSRATHVPLPVLPERRSEKREHTKSTPPAPQIKAQRPTHARSKAAGRNSQATPGMGELLRRGGNGDSELTFESRSLGEDGASDRSGRAPPCALEPSASTPAALPEAPPQAADRADSEPVTLRSSATLLAYTPNITTSDRNAARLSAPACVRACPLSPKVRTPIAPHVARSEGMRTCETHPSGDMNP